VGRIRETTWGNSVSHYDRTRDWISLHRYATALLLLFAFLLFATTSGSGGDLLGRIILLAIVVWFTVHFINIRSGPSRGVAARPGDNEREYEYGDGAREEYDPETGEVRVITPYDAESERRRAAAVAAGVYVKSYPDQRAFQRHAAELATDHWVVSSVVERKPNAGCLRIALLWWFVLIFPPRPELLVTYRYEPPAKPKRDLEVNVRPAKPAVPAPAPATTPAPVAATLEPSPGPVAASPNLEPVTHQACFTCGAIVSITHNFCPNCGARLGIRAQPAAPVAPAALIPMPAPAQPPTGDAPAAQDEQE
jgi:hypothetical protein